MAYTTINKSTDYFNTKLYTGNGGTQSITGVGFQPDFTWLKGRSFADYHVVNDAVRGATKSIYPNDTASEGTQTNGLTSFDSDGFSIGNWSNINPNGGTLASWNWKAGTTSGISAGTQTITPTAYSINTTAGFGIYAYEGSGGVSNHTISHGLGQKPSVILIKRRTSDKDWTMYHSSIGATKYLELNNTNAEGTSNTVWGDTEPTSSVFTIGSNTQVNANPGDTIIAYCFAEKQGYSKFGSYVGNGNADGTFIYTGFKPAFLMIKCTDATRSWQIHNSKSSTFNTGNTNARLFANLSDAEANNSSLDLLSNGFKNRANDDVNTNGNGNSYIYMAFAEAPLVGTNGVTAKAR